MWMKTKKNTLWYVIGERKMKIREITENKKQYISLLLLADEQESMIDLYLDRGTMYLSLIHI